MWYYYIDIALYNDMIINNFIMHKVHKQHIIKAHQKLVKVSWKSHHTLVSTVLTFEFSAHIANIHLWIWYRLTEIICLYRKQWHFHSVFRKIDVKAKLFTQQWIYKCMTKLCTSTIQKQIDLVKKNFFKQKEKLMFSSSSG